MSKQSALAQRAAHARAKHVQPSAPPRRQQMHESTVRRPSSLHPGSVTPVRPAQRRRAAALLLGAAAARVLSPCRPRRLTGLATKRTRTRRSCPRWRSGACACRAARSRTCSLREEALRAQSRDRACVCRLKKVRRAKRGVRGELSVSGGDWTRRGYAGVPGLLRSVHAASAARCARWLIQCCRRRAKTLHPLQRGCGGGHAAARRRPPRVGGGASLPQAPARRRARLTPPLLLPARRRS